MSVNKRDEFTLLHGGYFPLEVKEGEVYLQTPIDGTQLHNFEDGINQMKFNVEKGKTYYVRMKVKVGHWGYTPYFHMPPEYIALKELQNCKLIEFKK